MRQYVIIVSGSNLLLPATTKRVFRRASQTLRPAGFVTTRVVTAATREEACSLAIESARSELERGPMANDPSDPPVFKIEDGDIQEYDMETVIDVPSRGFIFY